MPLSGDSTTRESPETDAPELIPTRASLLKRLKNWQDQASWKDFFDTYWRLIYGVARKAGLTDADAQDVVQETIISVAKAMPGFKYDPAVGSFKGWLKQLTRWRIHDLLRKKQYQDHGRRLPREQALSFSTANDLADTSVPDLDQLWNEEWQKNLTEAALARIRQQVDPRQYQLFYLHLIKGVPAREVAHRLAAKSAQVYVAKYKVSALLRREISLLETRML